MSYQFWNYRRKIVVVLLFFLILFCFAAVSTGFWIHWTVVTAMLVVLFICDLLFLGENTFIFDPILTSWAQRSGSGGADY